MELNIVSSYKFSYSQQRVKVGQGQQMIQVFHEVLVIGHLVIANKMGYKSIQGQ